MGCLAKVEVAVIDLVAVATDAISSCIDAPLDKGLKLTSNCEGFFVRGNRDMLAAVVRNLVENAVKFTLPGGTIVISAVRRGSGIEIVGAEIWGWNNAGRSVRPVQTRSSYDEDWDGRRERLWTWLASLVETLWGASAAN